jgi:hypothetical protein
MTLPVYGNPLSLSQIQTEFGGSNPISLSEYYAGGSYVPAGTVGFPSGGGATAIPTTGTISINNFFGATKFTPVTNTYTTGSGNESVPVGAQNLTITVVGAGGYGGGSYTDFGSDNYSSGGGGGGGGYALKTLAVAVGDWGNTITWSVGTTAGASSTSSGTLAAGSISITANGGSGGGSGTSTQGGAGGGGGSATGGNTNTSGTDGGDGFNSGSSGVGGGPGGYSAEGTYGNGANGADAPGSPGAPTYGLVIFAWT